MTKKPKVTARPACPRCGGVSNDTRAIECYVCGSLADGEPKVAAESPRPSGVDWIALIEQAGYRFPNDDKRLKRLAEIAYVAGATSSGVSAPRDLAEGLAHQVLDAERRIEALTDALQQLIRTWRWRGSPKDNADEYWAGQKAQLQICADELDDVLKAIGGK